jgi:hypothetical protein
MDDDEKALAVDVLATMLQRERHEARAWLEHVAAKLEGVLPEHTTVERNGGLFSRGKVQRVDTVFDGVRYSLVLQKHGPVAQKAKVVRGIALATETIEVDRWIAEVAAHLERAAHGSEATRKALEGFVTK